MRSETLTTIAAIANSDPTIPAAHREQILAACQTAEKPARVEPGTIRDAARILDIHPVTVRRWAQRGLLTPIRITNRRVRYDLNEARRLATEGPK